MPERLIESLRCVDHDGQHYTIDVYQEFHPGGIAGMKRLSLRGSRSPVNRIGEGTFKVVESDLILRITRD